MKIKVLVYTCLHSTTLLAYTDTQWGCEWCGLCVRDEFWHHVYSVPAVLAMVSGLWIRGHCVCGPVVDRQGLSVCERGMLNKGRLFTWRAGHGWAWRNSHPGELLSGWVAHWCNNTSQCRAASAVWWTAQNAMFFSPLWFSTVGLWQVCSELWMQIICNLPYSIFCCRHECASNQAPCYFQQNWKKTTPK